MGVPNLWEVRAHIAFPTASLTHILQYSILRCSLLLCSSLCCRRLVTSRAIYWALISGPFSRFFVCLPSLNIGNSHWFYQAGAVHQYNHAGRGKSPELRTIYQRFTHLLDAPIIVVLVFDGPGRPELKRGKHRRSGEEHWLADEVRELADVRDHRAG